MKTTENKKEIVLFEKKEITALNSYEEKLKTIVKENPYTKVTDSVSAKTAEKRISNLRNARLALRTTGKTESQESILNKKIAQLKEFVKGKIDDFVAIVESPENKQKTELKRWQDEETEKKEKEKQRLEGIINEEESKLQLIIDSVKTFTDIEEKNAIDSFNNILDEFKGKEIDLSKAQQDYDAMVLKKSEELEEIIKDLTNENDLEISRKAKEIAENKAKRMEQLFDFNYKYKDKKPLGELSEDEYTEILTVAILEFRGKELEDLGFIYSSEKDFEYIIDGVGHYQIDADEICSYDAEEWEEMKKEILCNIDAILNPVVETKEETNEQIKEIVEVEKVNPTREEKDIENTEKAQLENELMFILTHKEESIGFIDIEDLFEMIREKIDETKSEDIPNLEFKISSKIVSDKELENIAEYDN